MAIKFFIKKVPKTRKNITIIDIQDTNQTTEISTQEVKEITVKKNNKKEKKQENMDFKDKIKQAEETLVSMEPAVKVVKSDKGLIERTESSKIVLTEDNRQLLVD